MDLKLFNTLARKKEIFRPAHKKEVRFYACGPTVYRSQHIGNYRTFIFEDVLKRVLMINGFHVRHIMNITDVGHLVSDDDEGPDKVEEAARKTGKNAWEVVRHFEKEFKEDVQALNILPPVKFVRATDHIKEQVALIKNLEGKKFTYRTSDGIYFDTSRIKDYGMLALRSRASTKVGARVHTREKKNPTDFALWKFSPKTGPKRQMEWPSPWGTGFPGWHIECSAMSMKYLGTTLDIHTGGTDHIQIHHPNEIAQSEAATGKKFSRVWMHSAFLTLKGSKMAKSSPETNITLTVLRERGFDPLDFRYFTLGTHYRKPLSFSWGALEGARNARQKLVEVYKNLPSKANQKEKPLEIKILEVLNDDLNTPKALALVRGGIRAGFSKNFVLWADHALGLNIKKTAAAKMATYIPQEIHDLTEEREAYRKAQNWARADRLRSKIKKLGWQIKDTPEGPQIHRL